VDVTKTFVKKHAVFLTGGDVFGFDTAVGVRRYLLERNLASAVGAGKLPGIVGANIYDVEFASLQEANYPELGYAACRNASTESVKEGNAGAGIGATVGKLSGMKFASKGGCGSNAIHLPNNIIVGALVVTNAIGNIYDSDGRTVAGVRRPEGGFREFDEIMIEYLKDASHHNTTIGIVATNVDLSHEQLIKVAQLAHDGLAMSIRPVHMSTDGDTLFAASTAKISGMREMERIVDIIGYAGAKCVARAVVRSARAARTLANIPGLNEAPAGEDR
jgi:L-aminopeptidase/D-esterase-like protein